MTVTQMQPVRTLLGATPVHVILDSPEMESIVQVNNTVVEQLRKLMWYIQKFDCKLVSLLYHLCYF